eukprot:466223_1
MCIGEEYDSDALNEDLCSENEKSNIKLCFMEMSKYYAFRENISKYVIRPMEKTVRNGNISNNNRTVEQNTDEQTHGGGNGSKGLVKFGYIHNTKMHEKYEMTLSDVFSFELHESSTG